MSFYADAARVRDATLPYGKRFRALAYCVESYCPFGFQASFAVLRELAGPFRSDEAALVHALDLLVQSRVPWLVDRADYANRRRAEKRLGRRVPTEPDPGNGPTYWYGPTRETATAHVLAYWWRGRPDFLTAAARDTAGGTVRALALAFVDSGRLSADQLASLAAARAKLGEEHGPDAHRAAYLMTPPPIPG